MIISNGVDRKKLFRTVTKLIVLIFILNYLATKFYLYYSIWYFDMPMHFLGGIFLGFSAIWIFSMKVSELELSSKLIYKILFFVLFIGVSWEVFEILFNNIVAQMPFNSLDTISDIFFDLAGGSFAILYFFYLRKKIIPIIKNTV